MITRQVALKGVTLFLRGAGFAIVLSAMSTSSWAGPQFPEMDPGLATSASALLAGGLALIAGRKRSK